MSKTCNNCRYGKRKMSEEPCFHCKENDNFEPQTNRQWIENMSDEKLALYYAKMVKCSDCYFIGSCVKHSGENCYGLFLKWLQDEHKE